VVLFKKNVLFITFNMNVDKCEYGVSYIISLWCLVLDIVVHMGNIIVKCLTKGCMLRGNSQYQKRVC
jgi:hypothetical protein